MAKESKFEKLVRKAQDAGKIRKYSVNPDVVALRAERTTSLITGLFWLGVVFGLAYTVPNVAHFMGGGFTGWFVSPAINAPLIALLLAHSFMARYEEKPSWQVQWGKFLLLGFEYGMNTWASWSAAYAGTGGADEVFKHSVPMVIVAFCAEGVTDLRGGLARCVTKAYALAAEAKREITDVFPVSAPPAPIEVPEEPVIEQKPTALVIPEPYKEEPVIEEPPAEEPKEEKPVIVIEPKKHRPAGGKRAQKDAEDIALMRQIWPGLDFLLIDEKARHGLVMKFFKCGGSRATRLRDMYVSIVETEVREEVR
jgi:hypothetical protein